MINNNTTELDDILNNISSEKELDNFLKSQLPNIGNIKFHQYFDEIRMSKQLKKSEIVSGSGMDRTYCYQVLNGRKNPSRDNVIKLCISCKLNIEETNKSLTLAGFNKLYSKDCKDGIIIFCINNSYTVMDLSLKLDELGIDGFI